MLQGNINHLLELRVLSLMQRSSLGLFDSYKHIYDAVDAIEEGNFFLLLVSHVSLMWNLYPGDALWKCFKTSFDEPIEENAPNWKKQEYDVWYHDPEVVIRNMLANLDFAKEFDPAPYVELDAEGGWQQSDFMSGNFTWHQSVCWFLVVFIFCKVRLTLADLLRMSFMRKILWTTMGVCLFQSCLGATKQLYLLLLGILRIVHCIFPSVPSTTVSGEHIGMPWFQLVFSLFRKASL